MKHSTGAPKWITNEQENLLVKTITKNTPDEVRFECKKYLNGLSVALKKYFHIGIE